MPTVGLVKFERVQAPCRSHPQYWSAMAKVPPNAALGIQTKQSKVGQDEKGFDESLPGQTRAFVRRESRQMRWRNPYGLTIRELTILQLVTTGITDKEVAKELRISALTVHRHISNILSKMAAASRTEASVRAIREGWVD